jgi:hypothetical protein
MYAARMGQTVRLVTTEARDGRILVGGEKSYIQEMKINDQGWWFPPRLYSEPSIEGRN